MDEISSNTYDKYESQARSYCRNFVVTFNKAQDSYLYDTEGNQYLDMLCGAGALNYGHNCLEIKSDIIDYIESNGVLMSLDLHTSAKKEFIETFNHNILVPRNLDYKIQFTSPTGTSVVESAVKLARKATGRQNVICFTNAFHGMSGTSLSLTGNKSKRQAVSQGGVTRLPYDGYLGQGYDSISYYRKLLTDASSGIDLPAAIILETIQGEGGVNVASNHWLKGIRQLASDFGILLIVDDIQAGVGRSGAFFSFERADIKPDLVCLSKSIGGIGFPMALLLINPEIDIWAPGEDNGTFRGNNLAFIASKKMIEMYWSDNSFESELKEKEILFHQFFHQLKTECDEYIKETRGVGLFQGIEFYDEVLTAAVAKACFENKILIETCGERDQVLKFMPALNMTTSLLKSSLANIGDIIKLVCSVFNQCIEEKALLEKITDIKNNVTNIEEVCNEN
ncbi:diaminobutyrate--2-oxoglutarate transaminase [Vibrio azureus]|uniref:Diaminobutyrate--2-oxoglutarate transaminase n=1 Tax=Vibrio azureus NBRC 104587 TaxID=1219077 RepID=U3CHN8_9VIBR|nr:diaminobutyrate--2-oxoglutarate transaminase [Vibrio azureus]AUI88216.1 diaminobutyrate--2-oxoglutarate transaminase [Vibrio azureus]GAD77758.1 diaminobutyrate--2-oxoglutarate transaminase [Vibrio azureus NBRC 104587]